MSMYLNPLNALKRLRDDWAKHGKLIVAVDFDSTLWPYLDEEWKHMSKFAEVWKLVQDLHSLGCTIIIFTASEISRHDDIKEQLAKRAIPWDLFNESPSYIPNIGRTGKVYANAYLDDRAGLSEVFGHLSQLVIEKRYELLKEGFAGLSKQMAKI